MASLQSDSSPRAATSHENAFVPRQLTPEERQAAWTAANFEAAISNQPHPLALWILGPSAVGKSTLTTLAAPRFGIPLLLDGPAGEDCRTALDAAIIDGEFMRDAHDVYKRWVKTEDWRSAYPALKSTINKEKDRMFTAAASEKKHMVIPQTLLNHEKGLTEVQELYAQSFTNHVLAVIAPLEECQARGKVRELETGKRYEPREYHQSIAAIPLMVAKCDGRYEVVRAIPVEGETTLTFDVLLHGTCGPGTSLTVEQLYQAIGDCVSPSRATTQTAAWPMQRTRDPSVVPRPLTVEERDSAWRSANFFAAAPEQEQPTALWILGPPCVGKTSLEAQLCEGRLDVASGSEFGIAGISISEGSGRSLDAVFVDGQYIWKSYGVFQNLLSTPNWKDAKHALKSIVTKEKDQLFSDAASQRKNIVVARRLTDLNKGLTEVEELTWRGYKNCVLAVIAPLADCARRAETAGIECERQDFEKSVAAIVRMIGACNGEYKVVQATMPADAASGESQGNHGLHFRVLASGHGAHLKAVPATSVAFMPMHEVRSALEAVT
eukprot:CAMPEP_0178391262 /NCGR_PEP_ID=MMETSP0689_2-20121128/11075_1 /TAXON_ID=160604 /ORGANISM="Amphidinium massartii, Strain CS-259" /LENGTH=550 /DNA_ID=CAMNT_0020011805 /DNA_START=114 /DNA_END=1762 /DNA_ORIENTATION=+